MRSDYYKDWQTPARQARLRQLQQKPLKLSLLELGVWIALWFLFGWLMAGCGGSPISPTPQPSCTPQPALCSYQLALNGQWVWVCPEPTPSCP